MYMQSPLYSCILAEYFKWFKIFAVKIYEPFIKKSDSIFLKLLMKAAKGYSAEIWIWKFVRKVCVCAYAREKICKY